MSGSVMAEENVVRLRETRSETRVNIRSFIQEFKVDVHIIISCFVDSSCFFFSPLTC